MMERKDDHVAGFVHWIICNIFIESMVPRQICATIEIIWMFRVAVMVQTAREKKLV